MPSSRAHPLIPRAVPAPGVALPAPVMVTGLPGAESAAARERAARAGGFHESSYELQTGLDVIESEWPAAAGLPSAQAAR
ncbi:MAG TPA: hypothetical protein VFQ16_10055 [Burkholderiaceae bacterium]|nr:hypothetical protein [Burkholderiaceae bacterium]